MAGIDEPVGADGFSFKPLLLGKKQGGREMVFTQFHQTSGRNRYPMRAVENARFRYIYNPWSDGRRVFRNESQAGRTMKAMLVAAKNDAAVKARCELFLHRVPEEFYDLEVDPDGLNNLIDAPEHVKEIERMRSALRNLMKETRDPALAAFELVGNEAARRQFMAEQDEKAATVPPKPKKQPKKQAKNEPVKKHT
jgi:N-sulfoglucosamine sulfohydrolase